MSFDAFPSFCTPLKLSSCYHHQPWYYIPLASHELCIRSRSFLLPHFGFSITLVEVNIGLVSLVVTSLCTFLHRSTYCTGYVQYLFIQSRNKKTLDWFQDSFSLFSHIQIIAFLSCINLTGHTWITRYTLVTCYNTFCSVKFMLFWYALLYNISKCKQHKIKLHSELWSHFHLRH